MLLKDDLKDFKGNLFDIFLDCIQTFPVGGGGVGGFLDQMEIELTQPQLKLKLS